MADEMAEARHQVMVSLEKIAEDSLRVAQSTLDELAKMSYASAGDGGEAVEDLRWRVGTVEREVENRLLKRAGVSGVKTWLDAALEFASDVSREVEEDPEQRTEYHVGLLQGALSALILAVKGDLK